MENVCATWDLVEMAFSVRGHALAIVIQETRNAITPLLVKTYQVEASLANAHHGCRRHRAGRHSAARTTFAAARQLFFRFPALRRKHVPPRRT